MQKRGNNIITALDIGTTKIVCFIARYHVDDGLKVIGIGHQVSHGIKAGIITDINAAEEAIRHAVGAAEQMAGINVDKVMINLSGSLLKSVIVNTEMPVGAGEITARDIYKLAENSCEVYRNEETQVVHCIPLGYSIDNSEGIKDPRGMVANSLGASLHVITIPTTPIANLAKCLARCHLDIENYVASSYASALACIHPDNKQLGTTLIDFGGGCTSIAMFKQGKMVFSDVIALGGANITNDIALGLSIRIEAAERLKTLHGSVISTPSDGRELIDIPHINEQDPHDSEGHISREMLVNIIRPRVEEILEMVMNSLNQSSMDHKSGDIIITGGASQLGGLKECMTEVFGCQVKHGQLSYIEGIAESTSGPAFSSCAGMLAYAAGENEQHMEDFSLKPLSAQNMIGKVVYWFKRNF